MASPGVHAKAALLLTAAGLTALSCATSGMGSQTTFSARVQSGSARVGLLRGLETPAVLLHTRRGFPAPLTLRELEALSAAVPDHSPAPLALQVSAAELLDEPGAAVLRQVPGGLKQFCGLHGRNDFVLLSARDSLTSQAGMPASEGWATLQTPAGQKKVTAAEYSELIGGVHPDVAMCLTDEVYSDGVDKKIKKSVERTGAWIDVCVKAREDGIIPADTLLLGGIVGGMSQRDRALSAQLAGARQALDGYAVLGLGCGETAEAREEVIKTCLEQVDGGKLRFISGLGSPEEVLWCAAHGFDLIESSYPYVASTQGLALTFTVDMDLLLPPAQHDQAVSVQDSSSRPENADNNPGGKLNLWDTCYARDTRPIASSCHCFSCAHYSRAYIHHLLNTHEMLAEVLLLSHNQHVFLAFLHAIRRAITEDRLQEYTEGFRRARLASL